eukprot:CAMPEP_0185202864 /NCGR_PEP_ID=MMETSP1140-20130426/51867_1 /TAXON_ID=298111 /ORGANISM="Pavlova sp., Strain CCMP459" /LENGTH=57 /DNA_ID=CAMNT_0027770337 /DNA_START=108 /DNA_END=281 /DNA_ORIENTATION=-
MTCLMRRQCVARTRLRVGTSVRPGWQGHRVAGTTTDSTARAGRASRKLQAPQGVLRK